MQPTLLLDSIETCLALDPLRARLQSIGLAADTLELWIARTLRDQFACEIAAAFRPMEELLGSSLRRLMRARGLKDDADAAKEVARAVAELPLHADVRRGLELARQTRTRVAVVTNGSKKETRKAFAAERLGALVETFVSAEDVKHFKPAREVYVQAAKEMGEPVDRCIVVSAHGWDLRGALNAGMQAAFVERSEPLPDDLAKRVLFRGRTIDAVVSAIATMTSPLERRRTA